MRAAEADLGEPLLAARVMRPPASMPLSVGCGEPDESSDAWRDLMPSRPS